MLKLRMREMSVTFGFSGRDGRALAGAAGEAKGGRADGASRP